MEPINNCDQNIICNLYMCLGYALSKDEKGNPTIAEILKDRILYLKDQYQKDNFKSNGSVNESIILLCGRGKLDIEAKYMAEFLKQSCDQELTSLRQKEEDPEQISKIQQNTLETLQKSILIEGYSMNTVENFLVSFFLLWERFERQKIKKEFVLKIITSSFHVERVKYIASVCLEKLSKAFKICQFKEMTILGAVSVSCEKTEEPQILWQKADEKLERILNFRFEMAQFMLEREFSINHKEIFPEFVKAIQQSASCS